MSAPTDQKLQRRVSRDQRNAEAAVKHAKMELRSFQGPVKGDSGLHGMSDHQKEQVRISDDRWRALKAISKRPFQAMVEVLAYSASGDEREETWYANEASATNEPFDVGSDRIAVLAWTHPGVQAALANDVGEYDDIKASGLRLHGVETLAKARFDEVLPQISGIYDPGGSVRPAEAVKQKTGLKAVKLGMTPDQVKAFIARMSGMMTVTGAPGSGKTTVAFQRIRFLIDQQGMREDQMPRVTYSPELTRVFLANENLAGHAAKLLENQLDIPPKDVIVGVSDFVDTYLREVWRHRLRARPRSRNLTWFQKAARTAALGLSTHKDLAGLWEGFERQISDRLRMASQAKWLTEASADSDKIGSLATELEKAANAAVGRNPTSSRLSMGAVFGKVEEAYSDVRGGMRDIQRNKFDESFGRWLSWVYDPLTAIDSYFGEQELVMARRMSEGTNSRVTETEIIQQARKDWQDRVYGPEDRAWIAWLLRFSLPSEVEPAGRFRNISPWVPQSMTDNGRWTHVVIDEAQDLSVAEASLLGSMVDPEGALTVSADFHQIVSPVHGMRDARAFGIGQSIRNIRQRQQSYPFAVNMRQSKQIGEFLRGFFEASFGERPAFGANPELNDMKPQVIISEPQDQARRIKQIVAVLRRSDIVESIALLQINEDLQLMKRLRRELEEIDVEMAPIWEASGDGLLTSSVERIKGLEFDACIVLGLEDVERPSLNFIRNRAYVALSRPARRLVMMCGEYPSLLKKVDKSLFEVTQA